MMETKQPKLILSAVGDVFLADSPFCYGHGVGSMLRRHGHGEYITSIQNLCMPCDIGFANLECVLSEAGRNRFDLASVEIRGSTKDLPIMASSPWQVVNIANNHIYQHGKKAFDGTVNALQQAGINPVGIESSRKTNLITIRKKGIQLGFCGFSLHPEQYRPGPILPYSQRSDPQLILEEIRSIRASFNGHLICSLHWGYEFMTEASVSQQNLARELIDAGVALVLGHHPHTLQGIERYHGGLIAYSLGNFMFDLLEPVTKESVVVFVEFDGSGIVDYRVVPVVIDRQYVPREATGERRTRILNELDGRSTRLESGESLPDAELKKMENDFYAGYRLRTYRYFIRNVLRFNPYYFTQSILRALLRRLGVAHNP